jgi:uncharacterized protein (TIGR02266 family)
MDTAKSPEHARRVSGEGVFTRLEPGPSQRPARRENPRYSVDLDVSLGSDHNFYSGFAENLSTGGVFVATHALKPVGEEIEFSIHLPEMDSAVIGVGEVRWIREYNEHSDLPPGMGIRFRQLELGAKDLIARFLARREPLFFEED